MNDIGYDNRNKRGHKDLDPVNYSSFARHFYGRNQHEENNQQNYASWNGDDGDYVQELGNTSGELGELGELAAQDDPYLWNDQDGGYFQEEKEEPDEVIPPLTDETPQENENFIEYASALPYFEFTGQHMQDVHTSKEIPPDHVLLFDKHSTLKITKGEACVGIYEIIAKHGLKQVVVQEIFDWLAKNTQSLNLPVELKRNGEDYAVKLKDYIDDEDRVMVLDVCRNEHMVFHGMQRDPRDGVVKDASKLINCWHCGMQRYSHCTHAGCQTKEYKECNPHEGYEGHVGHSVVYRKAMRTAFYRNLIPKLLMQYKKSLTAPHHDFLNYPNVRKKREGESEPRCIVFIT
jgi:hypothetical protein